MKIEKGKLYYNHQLECVIKAQTDYEDKSGLHSNKIAVHCPTKQDWDYVLKIMGNPRFLNSSNYNRGCEDSYICLQELTYGNLKDYEALGYHTITIEQFKQFYSMKEQTEPQYFAISPEEWQEYQEFKLKKQAIDYDKLSTGSKVMLKYTGSHCAGSCKVDFKKPFFVILKRIDCFMTNYDNELRFTKSTISESIYNTFIQDGKFIHFTASDESYITEVIEY